jgi:predicted lipoprotein with Yx(FWY)xxD motif
MRNPRLTVSVVVIALLVAIGVFSITAATNNQTHSPASGSGATTIHTATATVGGQSESILVDAKGDPLYTYKPDTATTSRVPGQLAALWPPVVSTTPTISGAQGTVTSVATTNGNQVSYNGHFLYSFVDDSPGHVTGQGVQDFFVATPTTGGSSASTVAPSAPSSSSGGYGY